MIEVALELSKLKEFLGREKPTVITVSAYSLCRLSERLTILFLVNGN